MGSSPSDADTHDPADRALCRRAYVEDDDRIPVRHARITRQSTVSDAEALVLRPQSAEDPINPSHYRRHPSGVECMRSLGTQLQRREVPSSTSGGYQDKGDPSRT